MKICFISGVISRAGGTERVGTMIANELVNRGYDVSILSFWNQGLPFFKCDKSIKIYYLLNPKTEGKLYRTFLYPIFKLRSFIKKHKFDVVIDIDTALSYYTLRAVKGIDIKHIAWEHFNYLHTVQDKKRLVSIRLIKKMSDQLVVLTKTDYHFHIDKEKFDKRKVRYIYNPTPFEGKSISDRNEKIFLAVGRLTYQKGFDLMLEAWKIVEERLDTWKLVIVGSGEDEEKLKDIIKVNKLKRVELIPNTSNIESWYDRACIYTMSSRYEGFPMVVLEAMAKGLPIISFDCVTGPNEMIKNLTTGILVKDGDISELAREMIELANDRKRQDIYSTETKKYIKNFYISKIIDDWERLLTDLVGGESV